MGVKMQHYKTGLVIGRFQPFHKGHAYLIKKALTFCEALIIGIGSANKKDSDNPWDASVRKKMIEQFLAKEKIAEKIKKIILLDDMSDEDWTKTVLRDAPADVVIGNNDWVNQLLHDAGYEVVTLPYFHRFLYEGQKIRKLMQEKKPWEQRMPGAVLPVIKSTLPHS